MKFNISQPQYQFINNNTHESVLLVGGMGSGKTFAGALRAVKLKLEYPQADVAYYMPTYRLLRMVAVPYIQEILLKLKLKNSFNQTDSFLSINKIRGGVIFRSYEKPETIIAYETGHSIVDELDTLPLKKAIEIWQKVNMRNRKNA